MKRALAIALLSLAACSGPDPNATTAEANTDLLPDFTPVQAAMGPTCATLDCHGQMGRNLRLYDARGLRLSTDTSTPEGISGMGTTTSDEVLADERSVLGLQPQIIKDVIRDHGKNPTRLELIRKSRGIERHKGGGLWPEGSDGDRCLISWLAGEVNTDACANAARMAESQQL